MENFFSPAGTDGTGNFWNRLLRKPLPLLNSERLWAGLSNSMGFSPGLAINLADSCGPRAGLLCVDVVIPGGRDTGTPVVRDGVLCGGDTVRVSHLPPVSVGLSVIVFSALQK